MTRDMARDRVQLDFDADRALPRLIEHYRVTQGAKTALIEGDSQRSWSDSVERIYRIANGLVALGIEPGEDLLRVHPELDDLQRDAALERHRLLREVDRPHPTFAEQGQDAERSDLTDLFRLRIALVGGMSGLGHVGRVYGAAHGVYTFAGADCSSGDG